MHEFRVPEGDFIQFPREPNHLFSLAIGILGDAAAAIADAFVETTPLGRPPTWSDGDGGVNELVRFSAIFFDAYIEAKLDEEITAEFALLCASAYYLSENIGNATVVARRSEAPSLDLGHGLARTAYAILRNQFEPIEGVFAHAERVTSLLRALSGYLAATFPDVTVRADVREICRSRRQEALVAIDLYPAYFRERLDELSH